MHGPARKSSPRGGQQPLEDAAGGASLAPGVFGYEFPGASRVSLPHI
ncbi:MAG TPA: hypothetical protein VKY19_04450 [Ktedonosporobacter sp.]|nr:hypothetical protein [Ktedonosporobacter sp.]